MISIPTMAEESLNLEEGKDYICIDRGITKSPPLGNKINKKPLCGEGKVPKDINDKDKEIYKLVKIDNVGTKDLTNDLWQNLFASCLSAKCEWASSYQFTDNEGVYASLTQHNPYICPVNGAFSKSGIAAIERDTYGYKYSSVEIGWIKTKYDSGPKLYTYVMVAGDSYINGCGWIQYSTSKFPGMPLTSSVTKNYKIDFWLGD